MNFFAKKIRLFEKEMTHFQKLEKLAGEMGLPIQIHKKDSNVIFGIQNLSDCNVEMLQGSVACVLGKKKFIILNGNFENLIVIIGPKAEAFQKLEKLADDSNLSISMNELESNVVFMTMTLSRMELEDFEKAIEFVLKNIKHEISYKNQNMCVTLEPKKKIVKTAPPKTAPPKRAPAAKSPYIVLQIPLNGLATSANIFANKEKAEKYVETKLRELFVFKGSSKVQELKFQAYVKSIKKSNKKETSYDLDDFFYQVLKAENM